MWTGIKEIGIKSMDSGLVPWSICIEMGPLVKGLRKEVRKYGNLGGKRCLQINGCCALHLKIGTKPKSHEVSPQKTKWEAGVCVSYICC